MREVIIEPWLWKIIGSFVGALIAIIVFFIHRYIKNNDIRHASHKGGRDKLYDKMDAQAKVIGSHVHSIKDVAESLKEEALKNREKSLEFQSEVNANLIRFKDQVIEINQEMTQIELKVDKLNTALDSVSNRFDAVVIELAGRR